MSLTVAEAKVSRLRRISGLCAGSSEWFTILNDTTRELMRRGQWWNTVKRMTGCVFNNCLVWPRQVGTLLALNRCGHSIPPKNHWYGFDSVLPDDVCKFNNGCWGDIATVDHGTTPVFNQIPCLNDRYIRIYISQPTDAGKTITLFGIDTNGQVIRSQRDDGTFQDGIVLTLENPFVQTPYLIRRIDQVIKDPTDGPIRMYQFDGATLYDMAMYDASETVPEYRQSKIMAACGPTSGCCQTQLTALAKLNFIPVQHDDDIILIDNVDALAIGMQSLKQSDAYDHAGAETAMARAVHTLNLDLRSKLPIDQIPVKVNYFGVNPTVRTRIGQVW
jgi:hypothetical protein